MFIFRDEYFIESHIMNQLKEFYVTHHKYMGNKTKNIIFVRKDLILNFDKRMSSKFSVISIYIKLNKKI